MPAAATPSNESAANMQLPRMQDIARFETQILSKNPTKTAENEAMQHVLEKITNPSLATTETDKKRFTQLHESLKKSSEQGNELATTIVSAKGITPVAEIEKLNAKLRDTKDASANTVLSTIASTVPEKNTLQEVSEEDYAEVEKMWEENYRSLPVPEGYGSDTNGRIAWITADTKYVEETIALLTDASVEKQQEGTKRVSNIMPILLLGGFSSQEVIGYLKAKLTAGTTVIPALQKEEEGKVTIAASGEKKQEENTLKVEDEKEE